MLYGRPYVHKKDIDSIVIGCESVLFTISKSDDIVVIVDDNQLWDANGAVLKHVSFDTIANNTTDRAFIGELLHIRAIGKIT